MRWLVVLVAALAALSGCAGTFDEQSTPTVTPVEVPTVETEPVAYPPGVDDRGLTSTPALAEGHSRALDGQSYVLEVHKCEEYVRNGTKVGEDCGMDYIAYRNDTTYRWNHTAGPGSDDTPRFGPPIAEDSYADGTTVFRRFQSADRVWYESEPASGMQREFSFSAERIVQLYLAVNESGVRRVERGDETAFRVVGRDHRIPDYNRGHDYRVVAVVQPSGLVTSLRADYNQTVGNVTVRTTVRSEYRDVGETTVEPPSWIDAARENVSTDNAA